MTSKTRVQLYADHFHKLCDIHKITIGSHSKGGRAFTKTRHVCVRPVRSAITYAIALHELGHILGPRQSGSRLDSEVGAWEWAQNEALKWTDAMTSVMQRNLHSYLRWSQRTKRARKAGPDHPIHTLLGNYKNPFELTPKGGCMSRYVVMSAGQNGSRYRIAVVETDLPPGKNPTRITQRSKTVKRIVKTWEHLPKKAYMKALGEANRLADRMNGVEDGGPE